MTLRLLSGTGRAIVFAAVGVLAPFTVAKAGDIYEWRVPSPAVTSPGHAHAAAPTEEKKVLSWVFVSFGQPAGAQGPVQSSTVAMAQGKKVLSWVF